MSEQIVPTSHDWVILIGGEYGAFLFRGSEAEAEEMRRHKARWESAVGLKRVATQSEASAGAPSQCLNHPNFPHRRKGFFYYCDCGDQDCVSAQRDRTDG